MDTAHSTPTGPRILVVGCGGLGGVVAAHLSLLGADVTALARDEALADRIRRDGLVVRGESALGRVPVRVVTKLGAADRFDYAVLATQPPQVEEAARGILGHLAPDGVLVSLQNGLCELRLAELAGRDRVIGAIVSWGATMVEPGVYDRTSAGGFVLGGLDGAIDARVTRLAHLLESIGPVTLTSNLLGARWSKLALNCAVSSLGTLGGERLGALLGHRFVRRLALELMTETVEVARAEGVQLEKVSGTLDLAWIALTEEEKSARLGSPALLTKHALLLAVGTRYRRLRSSMLQAIERGRMPAVDFLNGEVVRHAEKHGVSVPANAAVREAVWKIARGEERASLACLERVYLQTRRTTENSAPGEPPAVSLPGD